MRSPESRQTPRRGRALVALIALAAVVVVPAAASAAFATPVDLSAPGQNASLAQVAVAPDGQTTVTWQRSNGSHRIIQAATRPAGSPTFSAPVDLSAPGANASTPQIAVAPDGQTTITWQRVDGGHWIAQEATRPAGSSTFSAPVDLSPPGQDAASPQIAVAPDGQTTIAWSLSNGASNIIQQVTRPAGSSTFSAPVDLSVPAQNASSSQVAVAPDGQTTITWQRYDGANYIIQQATRPAGSFTFDGPADLSAPGRSASSPQVAVAPDGQTTITWHRSDGTDNIIQQATRAAGSSTFAAPVDLSVPGHNASAPAVAVATDGATTITWQRSDGSNAIIQEADRPAGAFAFSAPADLSVPGGDAYAPQVAVGPWGQTTITWYRFNGSNWIIQEATRPAGSPTFSVPVDLSAPGQNASMGWMGDAPAIAVGRDGQTTIAWDRSNGTNSIVQASTSTPALAELTVALGGEGVGSVTSSPAGISCAGTCAAYFPIGSSVALSASPNAGAAFTGWSGGGCSGAALTCTITISDATSVSAAFGIAQGVTPGAATPTGVAPLPSRTTCTPARGCTTRGTVPTGATRVVQVATGGGSPMALMAFGAHASARVTTNCPISTTGATRTYTCRARLGAGRWTLTTRATAGATVIAQSVKHATVKRAKRTAVAG